MGLGLSGVGWCGKIPVVREIDDRKVTMDTNLFSRVVHELVVRTTKYFPVAWEGGMRYDEVTRRVAISVSYFGIVDADPVCRRGLGVYMSTTKNDRMAV